MFRVDDRTGNVVTTVALFLIAATILYIARGAFLILVLSVLFAYLLEPAVMFIQRRSWLGRKNRTWAIAQVYLTATQQQRIHDLLARNHDFLAHVFERGAASIGYIVASAIWLFPIPILAAFILRDGRPMVDALIEAVDPGLDTLPTRILRRIDTMLAKYMRAQFILAGLSFGFYSASMLVLRFPYAIALGLLGGALEFLPMVGWIISAAAILTVGFLTHSHWIWMAGLLVAWRLVQDYVNSPRIMGNSLDLQPLTVVFALMVGGQVGGIAGVYLSVPIAAVLRIVWLECLASRKPSPALADPPLVQMKA